MKLPRRTLLTLWIGMTAASLMAQVADANSTATNRFVVITGPVLQSPTETTMTVTWLTSRDARAVVEYGPLNGPLRTAIASRDGLVEGIGRLHKVELRELHPGTRYRYRVVSREIVKFQPYKVEYAESLTNEFREFCTFDRRKTDFSFVVFNDLHDQPATIPELLQVAGPRPYDFVALNGDILSHLETEQQITAIYDQAATSFASTTPLVWVRGNHETRGGFARRLPEYLASPTGRYYFAFDHGPVHFIVLDAGEDKRDSQREYGGLVDFSRYRREQAEWLKAEVKTKAFHRAKFRVVLCHMPFPSKEAADPARYDQPSTFVGMADAFECFGPTLDKTGVDLMLSGHMHKPEIIPAEAGRHRYAIVLGGGPKGDNRTLIRVNVSRRALEATILRPDGSVVGSCRVPKR